MRQLRLRDVGGIIVIDFIDMAAQKNRDAVLKTIQKELERDRSKSYVVEISPLGLVEMTRHNVTDGVREILTVACRHCEGTGRVLSPESIVIDHLRTLRSVARDSKAEAFRIGVSPEIVPALCGPAGSTLLELENETGRWFELEPLLGIAPTQLEVLGEGTRAEIVRPSPLEEGAELTVRIGEPHPFVETDGVAWLESGYAITVHGALPYVGKEQRVKIERALRFSAEATLLDAEPALPEAVDRESDLLEPARRVGERLDVEGKTRGRRRRGTPRSTSNGEHVDPMSIEEAIEGGLPDYGDDPVPAVAATHERRRAASPKEDDVEDVAGESTDTEASENGDPAAPAAATPARRSRSQPATGGRRGCRRRRRLAARRRLPRRRLLGARRRRGRRCRGRRGGCGAGRAGHARCRRHGATATSPRRPWPWRPWRRRERRLGRDERPCREPTRARR